MRPRELAIGRLKPRIASGASESLQCISFNIQGSRSLAEVDPALGDPWAVLCIQKAGKYVDLDGRTAVVSEPFADGRRSAVVVRRRWAPQIVEHWSGEAPWVALRFAGSAIALMTVYIPHFGIAEEESARRVALMEEQAKAIQLEGYAPVLLGGGGQSRPCADRPYGQEEHLWSSSHDQTPGRPG